MGVKFSYQKLIGRIIEKCGTRLAFAEKAKISTTALANKLDGKVAFRNDEIARMAQVLDIPMDGIHEYFFCQNG